MSVVRGVRGKEVGKNVVASIPDVADRDAIEAMQYRIYVPRSRAPPAPGDSTGSTWKACVS
jgi:16S rRNA processing protein RimM